MLVQGSILVKMVYVYLIVQQVCAAAVTLDGGEIHAMWKHLQIHVTTISAEMVIAKGSPIRLTDVTAELVGLGNSATVQFKVLAQIISVKMAVDV